MTALPTQPAANDASTDLASPVEGHHRRGLPIAGFPVDPWRLVEIGSHPELTARTETLFALANGYLGERSTPEEGEPLWRPGVLINGFHETWPIVCPEAAFGLATEGQTIVDVPDPVPLAIRVDGELLTPGTAQMVDHQRSIDFRSGVLERRTVWQTNGGTTVEVVARRLVSFQDRHLIAASTRSASPMSRASSGESHSPRSVRRPRRANPNDRRRDRCRPRGARSRVGLHNRMVRVRNRVEAAWAQIDVQLIRRHDLIPNLIEVVRGYAGLERSTLEAVSEARSNAKAARGPAQRARAEEDLSGALRKLLAISEVNPDLQANQGFRALQTELVSTENLITDSRGVYNDAVQDCNLMIQRVPMNLMAQTMGFTDRGYYEVNAGHQGPTGVHF